MTNCIGKFCKLFYAISNWHFVPKRNVVKLGNSLGGTWWLGDFVAGKNGHEDTKAQRFHKGEEIKNS